MKLRYLALVLLAILVMWLPRTTDSAFFHKGGLPASTPLTVAALNLSNTTFIGGASSGTFVGQLSVLLSFGPFLGTYSIQTTGNDHAGTACTTAGNNFAPSAGSLVTVGVVPAGSYAGVCVAATQAGAKNSPFVQAFTITGTGSVACVNSGANLCFLLGSFGPDFGAPTWMSRPWDYTGAAIGQNQCNAVAAGFPIEGGADLPGQAGETYQGNVQADAACFGDIYTFKLQNEWNDGNCPSTNPWWNNGTNPGCNENVTAGVTVAQYKTNVCTMVNYIRANIPGVHIEWYGPHNDVEAAYDPSDTCQIDSYGLHIYLYGDCKSNCAGAGRSGAGDWLANTPYSCAPPGGIQKTLPNDIQCSPTSREGYATIYAARKGKPYTISEWCSAYGDTASPNGDDYGTWVIANWMKANNIAAAQHWSGDPDGQGASDCSVSNNIWVSSANLESAMNHAFGGTHYAGTFYTYKTLPVPYPYP